jgi:hypothetical protein
MRTWRAFTLGLLVGLLLAPTSGRALRRSMRDGLARAIDTLLRIGVASELT